MRLTPSHLALFLAGFLVASLGGTVLARPAAGPAAQDACPTWPTAGSGGQKMIVNPPSMGEPAGRAYSQAVRVGNMLYLAGQGGAPPRGSNEPAGDFATQTHRAFDSIQTILDAAGASLDDLVTMTVFITDPRYGDDFVRLRGEILKRDFPASALISIDHLARPEMMLEIQAVAALPCR